MTAPVLQCEGLSAGYGKVAVVRDLHLSVQPGEIVTLLGSNGSGKTTTLLTLAGLLRPLAGSVTFDGRPVNGRTHLLARRGLCLVPDDRSLFPGLTARQNLRLGVRPGGASLDDILDGFPALRRRLDVRAALLSGGEQQMLALGRALAGRPKVLIVDEMSMGLAPAIVQELLPVLRSVAEAGAGVPLVEQHVDLALAHADRGYVLQHGDLVATGRADELLEDRALLEASYLGGAGT